MHALVRVESNSLDTPRFSRSHMFATAPTHGPTATASLFSPARALQGDPLRLCTSKGLHGSFRIGATSITPRLFVEDFREHSLASLWHVDYGDIRVHFLLHVRGRWVPSAFLHHGRGRGRGRTFVFVFFRFADAWDRFFQVSYLCVFVVVPLPRDLHAHTFGHVADALAPDGFVEFHVDAHVFGLFRDRTCTWGQFPWFSFPSLATHVPS